MDKLVIGYINIKDKTVSSIANKQFKRRNLLPNAQPYRLITEETRTKNVLLDEISIFTTCTRNLFINELI